MVYSGAARALLNLQRRRLGNMNEGSPSHICQSHLCFFVIIKLPPAKTSERAHSLLQPLKLMMPNLSSPSITSLATGEAPYVVEPRAPHSHTLILLHGLGSNGTKFGTELLETGLTSSGQKLTELLPGARFVFPTSKRRRSTAFGRSMLTQWFDIVRLADPSYRKERQLDGLAESAREILEIIAAELQKVQPQNLVIGGLSQGCAMSLAILLSLEHSIGGYIGMSGYLTYQDDLESVIKDEADSDDPFTHPSDSQHTAIEASAVKAQALERDLLDLEPLPFPLLGKTAYQTPVFLGHGKADEKVPYALGEGAAQTLRNAGYQVEWKCYVDQGHWYKIPDEIDDICYFIASKVGWEVVGPTTRV